MYVCSIIYICNITASYFRKLVRHFQYSILFDPLLRSAKSVDLCQGAPSIRERSDLHKLAVELLQVITTTTTTSSDQQWWFLTNHQVMNSFVLRMKCSYLNNTESINEVVAFQHIRFLKGSMHNVAGLGSLKANAGRLLQSVNFCQLDAVNYSTSHQGDINCSTFQLGWEEMKNFRFQTEVPQGHQQLSLDSRL